ncbi:MAG: metallophosphoesterase [Cypionkella sp.]|uniref:metallophosphoesterase n=1 Tax=Cypionkella sp. TaxID=2811411 RepID=UPI002AB8EA29|nr:metallophosphoesterase [Cypionkella sp.]MDZ4309113.1 metallophosphoesterase [Cypionkella sp.]MDZ4391434.1 metallophosphoesterase [Cypionkella sp.]
MRTYAIGDIHGHIELLREVHAWIAADQAKHGAAPIVHVGDLVDRGPDCRGVVEYLRAGIEAGQDWVVLKGNHDRMFTNYIRDINYHDPCLRTDLSYLHPRIGGAATLESYGVKNAADRPLAPVHAEAVAAVPEAHLQFLESLPIYHQRGEVIYVHAGIRPGAPIEQQVEDDLVWIRKGFLEDTRDHGALIVHGHTALDAPTHYGNRLNIDSSAAYGGPLTAVVLEGRTVFNLSAAGRVPLVPA